MIIHTHITIISPFSAIVDHPTGSEKCVHTQAHWSFSFFIKLRTTPINVLINTKIATSEANII